MNVVGVEFQMTHTFPCAALQNGYGCRPNHVDGLQRFPFRSFA